MHFTVHLRGERTYQTDFSYGLVFNPGPVWTKGKKEIINLNPDRPDYRKGSIAKLIEKENLMNELQGEKHAVILVHKIGHGTIKDFLTLQEDLLHEGFDVIVHGLSMP